MVRKFTVRVNGKEYVVEVEEVGGSSVQVQQKQSEMPVAPVSAPAPVTRQEPVQQVKEENVKPVEQPSVSSSSASAKIVAPMSGVILKILVSTGQKVEYGQKLLILEAMKMENDIVSDKPGIVKSIKVKEGETVDTGDVLVELE
ncbi:MAG TPA: biotin/lipoyl-binding protein [Fervidobacterium sp.]|nr:biotin/lipoyl-binding protein [Fervidobacterium sp.]HOK33066.1 biotin/lipoyl-binding protein [Fervidobacterium sp.]HOL03111.1 biotin/lipoyl-binding protein [Fervidobacterium sp.]HON04147.1 biotin/lipoyl-binding protein [Fervidobacterium sp.]HOS51709.1 biotin/lipoyl-binding protein [Fervidobacterium sp.]